MEAAGPRAVFQGFKVPSTIPQDLLLIQDLVSPIIAPTKQVTPPTTCDDDSVDSSGESIDSADEAEAILVSTREIEGSSSSSSSSDSDSESESENEGDVRLEVVDEDGDDGEEGGTVATTVSLRTKNELPEPDILVPPIAQVDPEEQLEKVGEIMNIVNNVVIVKGEASATHRTSERALDSETLLVYEDRKVLGYIHETFGPTYQPMYQVKFNSSFPLDLNEARVSRPIFHVPARSNYVFLSELAILRGSDASNVHDEEPAEYELEFSDDEAEAAHKARLRQRRHGSRDPSVPASPAHVRDQDVDASYGWNPYAEHGAYDMDLDYGAGPSRPKPQPYDDPYSDAYNQPESSASAATAATSLSPRSQRGPDGRAGRSDYGSGQGREGPHHRGRVRAHGRGRGRGHGRGRGRGRGGARGQEGHPTHGTEDHTPSGRSLSPASQATGQDSVNVNNVSTHTEYATAPSDYTPFSPQLQPFGFAQPYPPQQQFMSPLSPVQPHINPRFAARFGMNFDMMQSQQPYLPSSDQYGTSTTSDYDYGNSWDGQWNEG